MRTEDLHNPDLADVWAGLQSIYDGFLSGDTSAGDARMHPEVTLWDSASEPLVFGTAGLAALRAARPAPDPQRPQVSGIEASRPVLDVLGDVAVLRHRFEVRISDGGVERVRNTSVWRRVEGRWLLAHNHEDVLTV
ncbi:MAG: DUF4440 domain-containing protein [Janthinobacterium lividum]